MFARSPVLALSAVMVLGLPSATESRAPFTLGATGAVNLSVTGDEARYGLVVPGVDGVPLLSISLGATSTAGALTLSRMGPDEPSPGRYQVRSWEERTGDPMEFQALFVAGSVERPVGVFHGESGTVTILRSGAGRIHGAFEIRARGFLAANMEDEDQWVTVRGTFEAQGDSTVAQVQSISSAVNLQ
jgi:hypothetical protein